MKRDYNAPGITAFTLSNNSRRHLFALYAEFIGQALEDYPGGIFWHHQDTLIATNKASAILSFQYGLLEGLPLLLNRKGIEYIFFMEDDDWYSSDHITRTVELFEPGVDIVGQTNRYYHVPKAMYLEHKNDKHSSLCSTAIRASVVPEFLEIIQQANGPLVDTMLWRKLQAEGRAKVAKLDTCVGLKGMTSLGLGPGHDDKSVTMKKYLPDPDREIMREWMGDDVELIMQTAKDGGVL